MNNLFKILFYLILFLPVACGCQKNTPEPPSPVEVKGTPADSRWSLTETYYGNETGSWLNEGKCYATSGEGRGKAYISATTEGNSKLSFGTMSGLSITGLQSGDAIVVGVPVESLPGGTDVDFMITLGITSGSGPVEWIFEHKEGNEWKSGRSFITLYGEGNHSSFTEHFSTGAALKNDTLLVRCRVTKGGGAEGTAFLAPINYESCRLMTYQTGRFPAATDTKKVLALGNSFSFYSAPVWMLLELARSQGHDMDLRMNVKSSQTFSDHLSLTLSTAAVQEGGYDAALLQDQSTMHSNYYKNPSSTASKNTLEGTETLVKNIRKSSPACKVILENTWSYPVSDYMGFGSYEAFDTALQGGTALIADKVNAEISPIGKAFAAAREEGFTLYYNDDKHQSEYGAYLCACVNYLMLYGGDFTDNPAADCNLPHKAAQNLRKIAKNTISNK